MRGARQDFVRLKRPGRIQRTEAWTLDALCEECARCGVKLTAQRRLLLRVLTESFDHPDVHAVVERARRIGGYPLGLATTYRFLSTLQQIGALERHVFSAGPARYELSSADLHDHMIEIPSGKVVEFRSPEIVNLIAALASQHSCRLLKYKLEVLVEPIDKPPR